jgi:MATE family multidrug resistance protein
MLNSAEQTSSDGESAIAAAADTGANGTEVSRGGDDQPVILSEFVIDPGQAQRILRFEPVLVSRIVKLGLPVIIGMLTQTAINMIDTAMVGRLPEATAVAGTAALGPSLIMLWAFGGFLSAISVGTQALTARRFGEGDSLGAGKVLTNSITVATVSSLVVTVIAVLLARPIFEVISHDTNVRETGISYITIRYFGLISMVMMASFKSFYDGLGMVRVHMTIAIFMNILNAVLNYGLIFGELGMPRMEVDGAAWASVIASSAGLVIMIVWSMRPQFRKAYKPFRARNFDAEVASSVTMLSLWSGLAILFAMTGFALFFWVVGKVDEIEGLAGVNTAAATAVINISLIVFMTCIAFGTSTATLLSQSLGAKNPDLAYRYGWESLKLITYVMGALGLLAVAEPEMLLRIFLPEGGGDELLKDYVINVAATSLSLCGIGAPIAAMALVLAQALYGAGESRFVMIVEGGLHFTCLVPLSYFFAIYLELGLLGCWFATAVYGFGLVGLMGYRFVSKAWTQVEL